VLRFSTSLGAILLLASSVAHADDNAEASRLFREAMAHYDLGNYDRAIASFKSAYQLTSAPELLFNIAQAYRRKGPAGCKDALEYFETYERTREDKSRGVDVQPMIAEMQRCARQEEARPPPLPTPAPPPPAETQKPAPPVESAPSRRSPLGPILTVAGGGALVAAGAIALWSISWEDDCQPRCSFELRDRLRTRGYVGYALVGTGAAGVLGGALWWFLQGPRGDRSTAWIAPAIGGLELRGRFE
jgi:tetratricopeptide (TPR) repeat protein